MADVTLLHLKRYMGLVGAVVPFPLGQPWRSPDQRPLGTSALIVMASCLKGFYLHHCGAALNPQLALDLSAQRLPTVADRKRGFLGHTMTTVSANPLAPTSPRARHPKLLPEDATPALLENVNTSRDRMVVTWLRDSGMRIGELTGLHLVDLHLRETAPCRECKSPHLHVCHRYGNANQAAAKTKHEWRIVDGTVTGGLIKRVSPEMIHSYFEYMTTEYPADAAHGMLLVQLHGPEKGQPWSADAARGMLRRAGARAGLDGRVIPHAFRHEFTTAVLDASGGDLLVAKAAGGWSSTATVDEIYGHPDLHNPVFSKVLAKVWGEQA